MSIRVLFFSLAILFASVMADAAELFDMNKTSVRALGMGNAYTALARGTDALFYNPAGLVRNGGIAWTILDLNFGASSLETLQAVADVSGGGDMQAILDPLYGEYVSGSAHAKTGVAIPFMAAAFYGTGDIALSVDNPAVPDLMANVVYDYGLAFGGAVPLGPMHIGVVAKSIRRTGTRKVYSASDLGGLDMDAISDDFNNSGVGFSLDAGLNFVVPGPIAPIFSMVYRNIGNTTFTGGLNAPPTDEQELIFGAAFVFNTPVLAITPTLDLRYADQYDIDLSRKINVGVEVNMPVLDARAGFHQGYYTLGLGLSMGLIRIEMATYGVEVGTFAGQKEDRRYVLQLTMDLGFDMGIDGSGGSTSSTTSGVGGSGGGGSSGSRSPFSGSLKRRR